MMNEREAPSSKKLERSRDDVLFGSELNLNKKADGILPYCFQ